MKGNLTKMKYRLQAQSGIGHLDIYGSNDWNRLEDSRQSNDVLRLRERVTVIVIPCWNI